MFSCSDFLEPTIEQGKELSVAIKTPEDIRGLILGAYDHMNNDEYYGRDFVVYGEVQSDNALSNGNSGRFISAGLFRFTYRSSDPATAWYNMYETISALNLAIQSEIEDNSEYTVHLKGQAKALRALVYMDILRLFGQQYVSGGTLGIPYVTEYVYGGVISKPARNTLQETWDMIEKDLKDAEEQMKPEYDEDNINTFTTHALNAFMSRFYLYVNNPEMAKIYAKRVIDSKAFQLVTDVMNGDVTTKNLEEAWAKNGHKSNVFELAFTSTDRTGSASIARIFQATNYGDIEVANGLYELYEDSDVRKKFFTTNKKVQRIVKKYPDQLGTDNIRVIRYAEVILNYAEALVKTQDPMALEYLNMIPEARMASKYTEATLENVLLERRKELAMEGHRKWDLLRNGYGVDRVDDDEANNMNVPFGDGRHAFPIPFTELNANPDIVQNKDY